MTAETTNYRDFSGAVRGAGGWFSRGVEGVDRAGRGGWIALTVLGFVFAGPLGLVILGYALFTGRFGRAGHGHRMRHAASAFRSSGNMAFDSYKAETLRRLEEEQESFEAFLERLREAKDKAEFDQFMDERAKKARDANEPIDA